MYVFHLKGMFTVFVFQLYLANSGRLSPLTSATVNPATQNGKFKGKGGEARPTGNLSRRKALPGCQLYIYVFLN